ncbi:MAG: 4-hydroxy-tetrahydrodipicolinate reductase [Burkholderiales bacterium]
MKLAIAGAGGRMGRTLIELVLGSGDLKLAAALDVPGSAVIGGDAGVLVAAPCGVKVTADYAGGIAGADCLVDFTRPEGTLAHLEQCVKAGVRMVIGTTGFSAQQQQRIAAAAGKIAIVFAPNMAVGVNVVFKLAETAARALGDGYDVEIIEAHHRNKVDAPSGTALRLGEIVAQALGRDLSRSAIHGREGETGKRDPKAIGFHAIRAGDIVGEHTVMFAGEGERVEVTVRSGSRASYAIGALRACRFLKDKTSGLYDMQDVLGLR